MCSHHLFPRQPEIYFPRQIMSIENLRCYREVHSIRLNYTEVSEYVWLINKLSLRKRYNTNIPRTEKAKAVGKKAAVMGGAINPLEHECCELGWQLHLCLREHYKMSKEHWEVTGYTQPKTYYGKVLELKTEASATDHKDERDSPWSGKVNFQIKDNREKRL